MNAAGGAKEHYFNLICDRLGVSPGPDGRIYLDCPACGKGHKHFSISRKGALCFKCGYKPLFKQLLADLGGEISQPTLAREDFKPPAWKNQVDSLMQKFTSHPDRTGSWQAYKPLSESVICARRLGYGVFPDLWYGKGRLAPNWVDPQGGEHWRCEHPRLIVPLLCAGVVVGFRCRSIECDCPRWLSPRGSKLVLFNGGRIGTPGIEDRIGDSLGDLAGECIWILENPIDALLVESQWGIPAVGTLGVSIWRQRWTEAMARSQKSYVVAYDHDASGLPTGVEIPARWKEAHPGVRMPQRGVWLGRTLRRAGVKADLYQWPDEAPEGMDIGDLMGSKNTQKLAQWFVKNILRREWTQADFRGAAMGNAKGLLARYSPDDICGCLEALRDGVLGDGYPISFMAVIEKGGEPPYIQQWLDYKLNPPPIFLQAEREEWQKRKDKVYDEFENCSSLSVSAGGDVRPGDGGARRSGRRKGVAAGVLPKLHQGLLLPGDEQG